MAQTELFNKNPVVFSLSHTCTISLSLSLSRCLAFQVSQNIDIYTCTLYTHTFIHTYINTYMHAYVHTYCIAT